MKKDLQSTYIAQIKHIRNNGYIMHTIEWGILNAQLAETNAANIIPVTKIVSEW